MTRSRPSVGRAASRTSTTTTVRVAEVPGVAMVLVDAVGRMHRISSSPRAMTLAGDGRHLTVTTSSSSAGLPVGAI